jgi:DNA polymerase type B, organellar and viral
LKYAKENGYEIVVIKGYNFNKIEGMFNDFITNLYDKKRDSIGFLKLIYKQLLNNFLGRFGLNFVKPITETVDKRKKKKEKIKNKK